MEHRPPELEPFARKIAASKLRHVDVRPAIGTTTPWQSKLRGGILQLYVSADYVARKADVANAERQ